MLLYTSTFFFEDDNIIKVKKIITKKIVYKNKWIKVVSKNVYEKNIKTHNNFYSVEQQDFVSIILKTPSNKFPLVSQFRPAINKTTIEFPSGLLEKNETPLQCAKKEAFEETGCRIKKIQKISTLFPDSGRMCNKIHLFYGETLNEIENFNPEKEITVILKNEKQIIELFKKNKFLHQPSISLFSLAKLKNFF